MLAAKTRETLAREDSCKSPGKHQSLLSTGLTCRNLSTLPFLCTLLVAPLSEPYSQPASPAGPGLGTGRTHGKCLPPPWAHRISSFCTQNSCRAVDAPMQTVQWGRLTPDWDWVEFLLRQAGHLCFALKQNFRTKK